MVKFSLKNIVLQFMSELGLESEHGFERFLQFGINAIRELNIDLTGAPTYTFQEIDQNSMTVIVPGEANRLLKAALISPNNNPVPLILDKDMILSADPSQPFRSDIFFNGYGSSAISGSSYRFDRRNSILKLSSDVTATHVYLEYETDIEKIDGKYMVIPDEIETIKSYIRWANVRSDETVPHTTVKRYEDTWWLHREQLSNRLRRTTVDEIIEYYHKGLTGSIS